MNSVGGQIGATVVLLVVAVVLVVVNDRRLSRRRSSVETTMSSSDAQGIRPANSGPMMVLLTIAAGCAAAAAVVGFVGRSDTAERNNSDDATVNRSTCLSTANADWRASVGVLLIGYVAGDALAEEFVVTIREQGDQVEAAILDGAESPQQLRDRGAELLASAVINDARIGDPNDPLCPFVAGDPDRTPSEPDRSSVDFDADTAAEVSTTTVPAPGDGFTSCVQVAAAGLDGVSVDDPRWTSSLPADGDGDGFVCE